MRTAGFTGKLFVAIIACASFAGSAHGFAHLWQITEVYTNSSGTLQFIELFDANFGEEFTAGQSINVSNIGFSQTNTFTFPGNLTPPTANKHMLLGTAGIQAAGAPAPDFIIPSGFLFQAGGDISFFGANSDSYTALPTDGSLARIWQGGNATNTPTNYAGQSGTIVVPEPATLGLLALSAAFAFPRRRRHL
jgi:hypothetical protein